MEVSQKWLFKGMSRLLGLDIILMLQDSAYFIKREDHPPQFQSYVEDYKERYKNALIMGGSFGLALLLSLRRYFPNYFSQFTINRLLAQTVILGGAVVSSTISVVFGGAKLVHGMKKECIIKADLEYYKHMSMINQRYNVDEETQVRYALSTEEFQEWKKVRLAVDESSKHLVL